jgi:hypothetical protein
MYHTTGLSRDQIVELCALINSVETGPDDKKWPPSLGLFDSVVMTLTYLRRNRVQEELAETYGTSQPTVSRAIASVTQLIKKALTPYVPAADDLDGRCQYLVDGTLLPCWSWAAHPELYSGKRKTTGMNVQVACTLAEKLAWISDPIDGNRHDSYCLNESGVLLTLDPADWVGDKGYVGNGMITPIKKPEDPVRCCAGPGRRTDQTVKIHGPRRWERYADRPSAGFCPLVGGFRMAVAIVVCVCPPFRLSDQG